MCSACLCVWRLSYVVDIAAMQLLLSMAKTYVETVE